MGLSPILDSRWSKQSGKMKIGLLGIAHLSLNHGAAFAAKGFKVVFFDFEPHFGWMKNSEPRFYCFCRYAQRPHQRDKERVVIGAHAFFVRKRHAAVPHAAYRGIVLGVGELIDEVIVDGPRPLEVA